MSQKSARRPRFLIISSEWSPFSQLALAVCESNRRPAYIRRRALCVFFNFCYVSCKTKILVYRHLDISPRHHIIYERCAQRAPRGWWKRHTCINSKKTIIFHFSNRISAIKNRESAARRSLCTMGTRAQQQIALCAGRRRPTQGHKRIVPLRFQ